MKGWIALTFGFNCLIAPLAAQDTTSIGPDLSLDSLLNTPVSTAAKYDQTVRQVAGSITIVTAEDIRRFGYRTLEEILQSAAGFYFTYNREYGYIGVRGFGRSNDHNNRILLLLDGHTSNEGFTGSSQFGAAMVLDAELIKRVEIIRGPASALYGTGALFAVVNVITLTGGEAGVHADVSVGTAGFHQASLTAVANVGRAAFTISGTWDERAGKDLFFPAFNDSSNNNGIARQRDTEDRVGVFGTGTLGAFTVRGRYGHRNKGVPTGAYGQLFNDPRSVGSDESGFVELQYEKELSDVQHLSIRTFLDNYAVRTELALPGVLESIEGHNRAIGAEARCRCDPMASTRLTMCLEYRNYTTASLKVATPGTVFRAFDSPYSVVSGFAQGDVQLSRSLSLLAGVRYDRNSVTASATTPRVALIWDPLEGTTLKAMYGKAFRAATPLEDGTRLSGATGHLLPERMQMAELIWIQRLGRSFALSTSLYEYRVRDMIDQASDSSTPLGYVNRDRVKARGAEVTLDARPMPATRGYLSLTLQHAVDGQGSNSGQLLANEPVRMLKLGFATDLSPQVSIATEWRGESTRITLADRRTSASLVGDVNLQLRPFRTTEVGIRVLNLLNTRYSHPAGVELRQDTIEQDGRSLIFRISTRF